MKKLIFSIMLSFSAASIASAQNNVCSVKGEMIGIGDSLIVRSNGNNDTILVKNNKFSFTLNIAQPQNIYVLTPAALRGENRKYNSFVAVPGEKAELKGDITKRYDITGSKFYNEYHEADLMLEGVKKETNDYVNGLKKRLDAGEKRDDVMKEYQERMPELTKKVNNAIIDFIKAHPDYEANAAIIGELDGIEAMEQAVGYLSENVKNGRMKPVYEESINKIKKELAMEEEAAKKQAAGVEATDFTLNDINGKPFTLSSLRGKYVLLDFWGSWCGWCIKGMPQMKEYYAKYKGKFEIVGVDCRDTPEKWKAAVEKHQLPWIHVYNAKGDTDVCVPYAIQGYPTKILIGPDGKIVKTIIGEDPAFYTFLDETFGGK